MTRYTLILEKLEDPFEFSNFAFYLSDLLVDINNSVGLRNINPGLTLSLKVFQSFHKVMPQQQLVEQLRILAITLTSNMSATCIKAFQMISFPSTSLN